MGDSSHLPSPPSPGPDRRLLQAGVGATALVAGRITAAVCGLIQVPITLAHLGVDGFGIWIALSGAVWSLAVLDLGLGFAAQNRVTRLLATNRPNEAAALIDRTLRHLWMIAGVVAGSGLPLAGFGRWSEWFEITDPLLGAQMPAAAAIVVLCAALSLPLSLATRIAAARQEMWLTGLWTTIGSVLGLGATLAAAATGASLAGFTGAACILPLAPHLGTWIHLRRRGGWPRAQSTGGPAPAPLWREGLMFFMPQVGATFASTSSPLLVALFAGPAGAAAFGVLQRLYGFGAQLHTLALSPTWPAYTEAASRSDATLARATFRTAWLFTAAFALPALLLTPLVPWMVQLWLGSGAPAIPAALLWLVAGWNVSRFCGQPFAMVLHGTGRMKSLAITMWTGIGLALPIAAYAGPRWGVTGVTLAFVLPYVFLALPVTAWAAGRALQSIGAGQPAAA